jgi:hypothetical protein
MRLARLFWSLLSVVGVAIAPASTGGYVPVCSAPNSAPTGDPSIERHHHLLNGASIPISISFSQAVLPPAGQEIDFAFWTAAITPNQGSTGYTYSGYNYLTVSPCTTKIPGLSQTGFTPTYPATGWASTNSASSNSVMLEPASTPPTLLNTVQFSLAVDSTLQAGNTQDFMVYYEIRFKSPGSGQLGALQDSGLKIIHLYAPSNTAIGAANFGISTQIGSSNPVPTSATVPSVLTLLNFGYTLTNQSLGSSPAPPYQLNFWTAPLTGFKRDGSASFTIGRCTDTLPVDPYSLAAYPYQAIVNSTPRNATLGGVPNAAGSIPQVYVPASFATTAFQGGQSSQLAFLYIELEAQGGLELDSAGKVFTLSNLP